VQYKSILAMIFNEIKCHVNTSLGLVGNASPAYPPVSAPVTLPGPWTTYEQWHN